MSELKTTLMLKTLPRCNNHSKHYMVYSVAQQGGVSCLQSMKYLTTSLQ